MNGSPFHRRVRFLDAGLEMDLGKPEFMKARTSLINMIQIKVENSVA